MNDSQIGKLIDELVRLAIDQLDLLLVVGIVVIIQAAKKVYAKAPKKLWLPIMVTLGFLAAWLTVPVGYPLKEFIRKGIIYAAGAEFMYQSWRTITEAMKSRAKGRG